MIVSDTPRVGSTLNVAAGVDTPVGAFHRLTDFIVTTFKIVFAGG